MKILLAPDSFKENLTAVEFCDIAEKGILEIIPDAKVTKLPLADGGEGTVEAFVVSGRGETVETIVLGPRLDSITATYGYLKESKTAVIEMSAASGLPLLDMESRNPMETSTYGTGQLILDALDKGCEKIVLGIGGSATNDCGIGMIEALGAKLFNSKGEKISSNGRGLLELDKIDVDNLDKRLKNIEITVACDVDNPLYGLNGAAYVYAPQKGADSEMVKLLDLGLRNFAKVIKRDFDKDVTKIPGAGAAGGLGAGLVGVLNAELRSGFDIIDEVLRIEKLIMKSKFDLIITGEGQINNQTISGKLPIRIAKLGKQYNAPTIAIVGSIGDISDEVYTSGIVSIFSIIDKPMTLKEAYDKS
ncbi:MAG: glycerate kinase, partial [Clostridiales bacterium]|nr:glycerate kinase [Clostridiales bacterium]